jgi:ribosome-binding factor A
MSQRLDRVDELLRQEIGAILEREVADPRIGFVTVTRVETSPDLAQARVWVSVIGTPEERTESLRALEHAMPYVRRELGGRIRIRRIPALHVHRDESIERGARVLRLIGEIEAGTVGDPLAPDAPATPGESLPTPKRRQAHAEDAPDDTLVADETAAEQGTPRPAPRRVPRGTARRADGAGGGGPRGGGSARGPRPTTRRRS